MFGSAQPHNLCFLYDLITAVKPCPTRLEAVEVLSAHTYDGRYRPCGTVANSAFIALFTGSRYKPQPLIPPS